MQRRDLRLAASALLSISLALIVSWEAQGQERSPTSTASPASRPDDVLRPRASFAPPDPSAHRYETSLGVVVYVVEDQALPLVHVSLALPRGGNAEGSDEIGLASLTASLMRRGGAGELEADALDRRIDALGLRLDALSGWDRSGILLDCRTEVLPEALELFADVLLRPRFASDRLEWAKRSLESSMSAREDEPLAVLEATWNRLVWGPRHPRARDYERDALRAWNSSRLTDFHRRLWRPEGAVVAVAGAVEAKSVVAMVERALAAWDERPGTASPEGETSPQIVEGVAEAAAMQPGLFHVEHPLPHAAVAVGHPGVLVPSSSEDFFPSLVLYEILDGGGSTSRLLYRLREERQLVYRVVTNPGFGTEAAEPFRVFFETRTDLAATAVAIVLEEMARLRVHLVRPSELERAKASLLDSFPRLFADAETTAGRYAEDELFGRNAKRWLDYRSAVLGVTAEQVRRAAQRQLQPGEARVLTVGAWRQIGAATSSFGTLEGLVGSRREVPRAHRQDPTTEAPRF